jgi:hypothetical protein
MYVQHLIRRDAALLRRLIVERHARVYVCGDGAGMARGGWCDCFCDVHLCSLLCCSFGGASALVTSS